jgi:hypothetical protein
LLAIEFQAPVLEKKMGDFIYDKKSGACIARIAGNQVISEATKKPIATIRAGKLYGIKNDELLGHLEGTHVVPKIGDLTADAFARLLNEE